MIAYAEYEHFKKMLDKVIGQDEHLHKARREGDGKKHKGGEEVLIDAFNNDVI